MCVQHVLGEKYSQESSGSVTGRAGGAAEHGSHVPLAVGSYVCKRMAVGGSYMHFCGSDG